MCLNNKKITVVCGHYGCGKTNLSINLALDCAKKYGNVTLVDMDIVNPYFRSSDYTKILEQHGIRVIAPRYAGTNVDVPALSPEIASVFEGTGNVIFDVGGDDAGATALGRFYKNLNSTGYEMLYTVNRYRSMTTKAQEAAEMLREIERVSRQRATAVVNNSHLKQLTDAHTILDAVPFGEEVAKLVGLPLLFTTATRNIAAELNIKNLYPVDIYVRTPWE